MILSQRWLCLAALLALAGCEGDPAKSPLPGDDDDDSAAGCSLDALEPGPVPPDLPEVDRMVEGDDPATGHLVTSLLTGGHRPVVLDTGGRYVWWGDAEEPGVTVSRALLTRDRCAVLHLAEQDGFDPGAEYVSRIHRTEFDGGGTTTLKVLDLHHDLVELADGTLASIAREFREIDGVWVAGDQIVEIAPDGTQRVVWSVWDHWDITPQTEPQGEAIDWSHANALDHDEASDLYLISLRHLDSIAAVDRGTGETAWVLGGDGATVELLGDPELDAFHEQHQFQLLPGGVLVFDNGETEGVSSRTIEYAWSGEGAVEAVWRHIPDPTLNCYALGDVTRLGNGNTGITWSTAGRIDEITPGGELVSQIALEMGAGFGYTTWVGP